MDRRKFLYKTLLTTAVLGSATGILLAPKRVYAAWPKAAFDEKDLAGALKSVYGDSTLFESTKVKLKAPDIAENGAIVPINVKTNLKNVESIMIFVENNPQPLSSGYRLTAKAEPKIGTRLKMGKTSRVIAAVKSDGKIYSASKEVKVTIGGCGG
ncbi:MAG: thiosulfate oxidation carrier protein SoxY [Pseudomonadota bacterium]|nr:thiosulfate oxidation carrier protein SoxY [Pseudomonadota bacterium]